MALPAYLNFTNNIRTHAAFVGFLLALDAIITLLMCAAWVVQPKDLPKELQHVAHMKEILLTLGLVNVLFAIFFWVGFLKRQRWCLTVFLGYMAVAITLQFIGLLGAMLQLNIVSTCAMLIVLAVNAYVLLVTLQLRKVNSDSTHTHDGYSV
uniref:MARVEL domain-containing protein n=1 Tax=Anopheles minimus TaxID=112268 RepID=A0A182WJJ2_9DIPT